MPPFNAWFRITLHCFCDFPGAVGQFVVDQNGDRVSSFFLIGMDATGASWNVMYTALLNRYPNGQVYFVCGYQQ